MVTDTGAVEAALDVAQKAWPDTPRGSQAIGRLMEMAANVLTESEEAREAKVRALTQFGSAFPDGYLDDLREEWNE